jgi:Beta-lactamase enzyme family
VSSFIARAAWRSAAVAGVGLLLAGAARAYPLDGYEATGIRRLEGMRLAQQGAVRDVKQPPGALLNTAQVEPRLVGKTFDLPAPDPGFTQQVVAVLGGNPEASALAVLDLSDPAKPIYAEYRGDHKQNVGSVGKLVVALALFQALADLYPDDLEARQRLLKTTVVTADSFSQSDHHTVRIFDPATNTLTRRTVRIGDRATLYEWLDWMLSPSSNSAAGMVMREAMLLRHFGRAYPASEAEIQRFFNETPKAELAKLYAATFHEPVTRNGLDIESLRQGSFFTAGGKARVPGAGDSYGTARELMRYLLRLEQGRIVDVFSSREIKRLIYLTEVRIRYASSPALASSAVYFKSGSLYQCAPEPGFSCKPYAGNVKNYMNSTAIVESPAGERKLFYISTLVTNILRKNSASEHQALATRLHGVIGDRH